MPHVDSKAGLSEENSKARLQFSSSASWSMQLVQIPARTTHSCQWGSLTEPRHGSMLGRTFVADFWIAWRLEYCLKTRTQGAHVQDVVNMVSALLHKDLNNRPNCEKVAWFFWEYFSTWISACWVALATDCMERHCNIYLLPRMHRSCQWGSLLVAQLLSAPQRCAEVQVMLPCIQEEKHIEGLKNYRGLNKFKRACLNMSLVMIHGFVIPCSRHHFYCSLSVLYPDVSKSKQTLLEVFWVKQYFISQYSAFLYVLNICLLRTDVKWQKTTLPGPSLFQSLWVNGWNVLQSLRGRSTSPFFHAYTVMEWCSNFRTRCLLGSPGLCVLSNWASELVEEWQLHRCVASCLRQLVLFWSFSFPAPCQSDASSGRDSFCELVCLFSRFAAA